MNDKFAQKLEEMLTDEELEKLYGSSSEKFSPEEVGEIVKKVNIEILKEELKEKLDDKEVTNDFKDFAQEGMLKGYQSDVYLKTPIYGINGKVNLDGIKESGFNVYGKCEFGFDRDYKSFDYEHQTGKMVQLHEYDWNLQNYNQGWYPQENPNFKLNENIAILKTENEWKFNIEQGGTLEKDEYSIKLVVYVGNDLDMTYKEYLENEKEKETLDNSKNNDNDYDLELD